MDPPGVALQTTHLDLTVCGPPRVTSEETISMMGLAFSDASTNSDLEDEDEDSLPETRRPRSKQ